MKIIFLDFDGVIRIPVFGGTRIEGEFCNERMNRVAELSQGVNAKIVISSDWKQAKSFDEILSLIQPSIQPGMIHSDWSTPTLESNEDKLIPRGAEIISWLHRNPETENFVILDDLSTSHFPLMTERLVQCTLTEGFTEERFSEALILLSK